MSEFKETVTTSQDEGTDNTGAKVQQKTRSINTETTADSKSTTINIVWYIVGFIGVFLALRFILKLLGANPASGFVNFIYAISGILTAPFDNIFRTVTPESGNIQSVFEPSILVAMAVYTLLGWGVVKLLHINRAN